MKGAFVILLAIAFIFTFTTMAIAKGPWGPKNDNPPLCAPEVVTEPVNTDEACWMLFGNLGEPLICIEWAWGEDPLTDCVWDPTVDKFSIELVGEIEDCRFDVISQTWSNMETDYDIGTGDDDVTYKINQDGSGYALCIPLAVVAEGLQRSCDVVEGEPGLEDISGSINKAPTMVYTEIKGLLSGPDKRNKNLFSTSGCVVPPFRPVPTTP